MRKVTAVFGSLAFIAAAAALADDRDDHGRNLKGTYGLSGGGVCVLSNAVLSPVYIRPAGFTPTFVPIGHASSNSFSSNGVLTFNEDGTGTLASRVVSVGDPDPGDSGATCATDTSSNFTHSVGDDGTFTLMLGPITSTFVAGPRVGIQTQTTNLAVQVGHVSRDRKSLVYSSYDPAVETTTRLDLGVVESMRICHRSNTAIRIDGDQDR